MHMPLETLYPEKTLRYQVLELFLNKRRQTVGLAGTIRIPLQELRCVLEYAKTDNEDNRDLNILRIESLADELISLNEEKFGDLLKKRPLINVINKEILNNLPLHFERGNVLVIECTSKNIEDYILELKNRTRVAMRINGMSELIELSTGGVKIVLGDKEMKINKTKGSNINLRVCIVKLMYGQSITIPGRIISINDYERGNSICYNDLLESLREIEATEDEALSKITFDSIYDAIRGLNERSMEIFEHSLFEIDNEGLKWIL